ncbi:hypothetical protein BFN03_01040 [Rhodococcus sp. WMMA185]|nr:hypothetical protein BFN03_01040 [Rhodococcus sp. WMMA185]
MLAVRNLVKGKQAVDRIKIASPDAVVPLQRDDLTSLDNIHAVADELRANRPRIEFLINNACVM